MEKYKILDLFSGLGGFSLGLERTGHFETVAFCDNNQYSKLILDKHWKGVKIYDDVREISKEKFKEDGIEFPDIITGGFPCQPFSVAGKQKGTSDDRHLWPEMFRIIKAFKPRYVIGENVRGIVNIQDGVVFETVCTDLESEGYEVQPFIIPAAGVGAPHRRERVWIIATNTESERTGQNDERLWQRSSRISGGQGTSRSEDVGNTQHNGLSTSEIGRRNEEINGGTEKRENRSFEFEGTSGREDNGNVSTTNVADTDSRLRGGGRTIEPSRENKEGFLYSKEEEQTRKHLRSETIGRSSIRGETTKINVADTNDEGVRTRIGGSDNDHETESRSWRADGKGGSSDDERHNSTSTENEGMDVANTLERNVQTRRERQWGIRPEDQGQGTSNNVTSGSETSRTKQKLADTDSERLEGQRQGSRQFSQKFFTSDNSEGQQGGVDQGWWSVEPNVGRVAHGVSGRVHRLKGLGNSIVPQIVEEIGKAIIEAEKE